MAKKERKEESPPGAPAWLLTYGDMVTLVLTFFVLLVSMMVVDPKKFVEVLGTYQNTFGEGHDRPTEDDPVKTEDYFTQIIKVSSRTEDRDGGQFETQEGEAVRVYSHMENYVVKLADNQWFDAWEIQLTDAGKRNLDRVATILKDFSGSNRIRLIGHYSQSETSFDDVASIWESRSALDNQPVKACLRMTQVFNDNSMRMQDKYELLTKPEDLSTHRALAVQEYLVYKLQGTQVSRVNFELVTAGVISNMPLARSGKSVQAPTNITDASTMRRDFGSVAGGTTIMRDSAEASMNKPPLKDGQSLRAWQSFIFVEGGNDFGRTVEIIVTGEQVAGRDRFLLPYND